MFRLTNHIAKFNLDDPKDMVKYHEILNNPLCNIIEQTTENQTNNKYGDDGNVIFSEKYIIHILQWEERSL